MRVTYIIKIEHPEGDDGFYWFLQDIMSELRKRTAYCELTREEIIEKHDSRS